MNDRTSRRSFFRNTSVGAAMLAFSEPFSIGVLGANQKLNIACVGVGGKGWSDMVETSKGQNVVAVCDVDDTHLARARERSPGAKTYGDWRHLLEQTPQTRRDSGEHRHRLPFGPNAAAVDPGNSVLDRRVIDQKTGLEVVGPIEYDIDSLHQGLDVRMVDVRYDGLDFHVAVDALELVLGDDGFG